MAKFNKTKVAVWCYYKWELQSIKSAENEFLAGMAACEGAEKERYTNIFLDIQDIKKQSIDNLKSSGLPFKQIDGVYYPVASDQEEEYSKNFDAVYFDNKKHAKDLYDQHGNLKPDHANNRVR